VAEQPKVGVKSANMWSAFPSWCQSTLPSTLPLCQTEWTVWWIRGMPYWSDMQSQSSITHLATTGRGKFRPRNLFPVHLTIVLISRSKLRGPRYLTFFLETGWIRVKQFFLV
jgi:hypothetical protein